MLAEKGRVKQKQKYKTYNSKLSEAKKNTQNQFYGLYTKPDQNESGARKKAKTALTFNAPENLKNLLAIKPTTEGTKM